MTISTKSSESILIYAAYEKAYKDVRLERLQRRKRYFGTVKSWRQNNVSQLVRGGRIRRGVKLLCREHAEKREIAVIH